jgi:hypothetical protein
VPPILGLALALTFYKVNGKTFVEILQAYVIYIIKGKLYIWKQRKIEKTKNKKIKNIEKKITLDNIPKLSESRLADLSWSLDVLDMEKREK